MSPVKAATKPKIIKPARLQKEDAKKVASMMPKPAGYQLLILIPRAEEQTEKGVWKPESLVDRETTASVVGFVQAMGPEAYKDPQRFPTGEPWCKEEDWVIFSAFAGTRIEVADQEMRIINDDCVQATVEDPRGIKRL